MKMTEAAKIDDEVRLPHDTLVVVTDSEHTRFLVNEGTALAPELRQFDAMEEDNPKAGAQMTDRPGRMADGPNHRSAMDETDHHALQKARYAADLAELLRQLALRDAYAHLVLVAGPSVLGMLREHLHAEVQRRVLLEVDKNLVKHSDADVLRIITAA